MRLFASLRLPVSIAGILLVVIGVAVTRAADPLRIHADALALRLEEQDRLPPVPADVAELKFGDVFERPAGPAGLKITDAVRRLDGKRVRLLGFMVRQQRPTPGMILFAPFPLVTSEDEYGLADDLPPQLFFVSVPKYRDIAVPFTPGPLLLTGTLSLGPREEADGRVSHLRLQLDADGNVPSLEQASTLSSN